MKNVGKVGLMLLVFMVALAASAQSTIDVSSITAQAQTDITSTVTGALPYIAGMIGLGVALRVVRKVFGQ